MIFGEDGNRRAAIMAQRKQQYADELRRQIEEKQNITQYAKQTPSSYSTAQQEPPQNTPINNRNNFESQNQYSNIQNPNNNFQVHPPSGSKQSPHRSNYVSNNTPNQNDYNDYPTQSYEKSYQQSHVIAPLSINIQQPSSYLSSGLMSSPMKYSRVPYNADPRTFNDRIMRLDESINQFQFEVGKQNSDVNNFTEYLIPQIGKQISELRTSIDFESSQNITQKTIPIKNAIREQRKSIEDCVQEQKDIQNSIVTVFSELGGKISPFQQLITDTQETSRSAFSNIMIDLNRHRTILNNSMTRIGHIDVKNNSILGQLSPQNDEFNSIDQLITQNFENLQLNTNDLMRSISDDLASEIHNQSNQREKLINAIQAQITQVYNNSNSSIIRLNNDIKQISFANAFQEISPQISTAINNTISDIDYKVYDITNHFDTFLQDCEENFGNIQHETVSTIEAIKANHMGSINLLETSVDTEARIRSKNHKEILQKYKQFEDLIKQEGAIQQDLFNKIIRPMSKKADEMIRKELPSCLPQIQATHYFIDHIGDIEVKLLKLEENIHRSRENVMQRLLPLQNQIRILINKANDEKKLIEQQFKEIEQKVQTLEGNSTKSNGLIENDIKISKGDLAISKRSEINEMKNSIEQKFDKKIQSAEDKLTQIINQIISLQRENLSYDDSIKLTARTEGSLMIENLANQDDFPKPPQNDNDNQTNEEPQQTEKPHHSQFDIVNQGAIVDQGEIVNQDENDYDKINSNVEMETTQKFHFDPENGQFSLHPNDLNENASNISQDEKEKNEKIVFFTSAANNQMETLNNMESIPEATIGNEFKFNPDDFKIDFNTPNQNHQEPTKSNEDNQSNELNEEEQPDSTQKVNDKSNLLEKIDNFNDQLLSNVIVCPSKEELNDQPQIETKDSEEKDDNKEEGKMTKIVFNQLPNETEEKDNQDEIIEEEESDDSDDGQKGEKSTVAKGEEKPKKEEATEDDVRNEEEDNKNEEEDNDGEEDENEEDNENDAEEDDNDNDENEDEDENDDGDEDDNEKDENENEDEDENDDGDEDGNEDDDD